MGREKIISKKRSSKPRPAMNAGHATMEDVIRMRSAVSGNEHGDRDSLVIHLCYLYGLRPSELANVKISHFDFHKESPTLTVQRGMAFKTEDGARKDRTYELALLGGDEELDLIRCVINRYRLVRQSTDTDWLIVSKTGGKMSNRSIYTIVVSAAQHAGITEHMTPQMLRNGCSLFLKNYRGMPDDQLIHYLGVRTRNAVYALTEHNALSDHDFPW